MAELVYHYSLFRKVLNKAFHCEGDTSDKSWIARHSSYARDRAGGFLYTLETLKD